MAGKSLASQEGFDKYLTNDIYLATKQNPNQKLLFISEKNPKKSTWYIFMDENNEQIKIHHKNIIKPGREKLISVKPQDFGVFGYFETPFEVANKVYDSLDNFDDFNRNHILYLLCKFNEKFGKLHSDKIKYQINDFKSNPNNIVLAKDFGEILGVLYINKNEIYYPKELNYPLFDYIVDNVKYSAKTLKTSNTVKLSHVKNLLNITDTCMISDLIKDYYQLMITNRNIEKTNIQYSAKIKEMFGFKSNGCGIWREYSEKFLSNINNFYDTIISKEIKTVVCDANDGLNITVRKPSSVRFRLKENKEQLGFELIFT